MHRRLIHAQPDPVQTPRKSSRNGYKPPSYRSSLKPLPQKENPSSNPSGHPHSCRKTRFFDLRFALAFLLGADDVGDSEAVATLRGQGTVVAAVQVQGLNVQQESAGGDGLQGGFEQDGVVAVRSVDDPADGDPEQVSRDRPLPPDLGSVRGVGAGPFTTTRGFVQAAVDGDLG